MSGQYGASPPLRHLAAEGDRALIVALREAVAPILANNILPHFTDHSVIHSDSVTRLIDDLAAPVQATSYPLSSHELIVLYAACYLHDIGLQYERAGDSATIQQLNLNPPWQDLDESTRRELLRNYHHLLSAELVRASTDAATPIIGLRLRPAYDPSRVACLCEAHNLWLEKKHDSQRYHVLTEDGPRIRMGLLSGLLRVADILDESRRRALPEKARTLLLPILSKAHWWRHYYTESVTFEETDRTITLWFDFPANRAEEYSRIVPTLQTPGIEAELRRHQQVFNKYGVSWSLVSRYSVKPYSDTEEMPSDVLAHMLGELRAQHVREEEIRREAMLSSFAEARPHVSRRLEMLKSHEGESSPAELLLEAYGIANELWSIGSRYNAVTLLNSRYGRDGRHLEDVCRIKMGSRLLEMLLEDGALEFATGWILTLQEDARRLVGECDCVPRCMSLIAEWFERRCALEQAVESLEEAISVADDESSAAELRVRMKEMQFLQGTLHLTRNDGALE